MSNQGWIGVDLDETLAHYEKGDYNAFKIGPPILKMVRQVQQWLKEGKTVKIFTARANPATETPERLERVLQEIRAWCLIHIGQVLDITCSKDYHMYALYDDRAKQIVPGTGDLVEELLEEANSDIQDLHFELNGYKWIED